MAKSSKKTAKITVTVTEVGDANVVTDQGTIRLSAKDAAGLKKGSTIEVELKRDDIQKLGKESVSASLASTAASAATRAPTRSRDSR